MNGLPRVCATTKPNPKAIGGEIQGVRQQNSKIPKSQIPLLGVQPTNYLSQTALENGLGLRVVLAACYLRLGFEAQQGTWS